jgi:hypothetical protein
MIAAIPAAGSALEPGRYLPKRSAIATSFVHLFAAALTQDCAAAS